MSTEQVSIVSANFRRDTLHSVPHGDRFRQGTCLSCSAVKAKMPTAYALCHVTSRYGQRTPYLRPRFSCSLYNFRGLRSWLGVTVVLQMNIPGTHKAFFGRKTSSHKTVPNPKSPLPVGGPGPVKTVTWNHTSVPVKWHLTASNGFSRGVRVWQTDRQTDRPRADTSVAIGGTADTLSNAV